MEKGERKGMGVGERETRKGIPWECRGNAHHIPLGSREPGKDTENWFSCIKGLLITGVSGNHCSAFLADHSAGCKHEPCHEYLSEHLLL